MSDELFIGAEYGCVIAARLDVKEFIEIDLIDHFVRPDSNFPVDGVSWSHDKPFFCLINRFAESFKGKWLQQEIGDFQIKPIYSILGIGRGENYQRRFDQDTTNLIFFRHLKFQFPPARDLKGSHDVRSCFLC